MTSMTLEAADPAAPDPFDAVMEITSRPPLVFVEGRGSWLRDRDGKDYLDFIQGWAVNCLGHCPQPIVDAIARQAGRLINCSPAYHNEPMIRLAKLIARHSGLDRTFFTNSGAEANEGAIKLARKWGKLHLDGASEIITVSNAFHGRTIATVAATGNEKYMKYFTPMPGGFTRVPFNDVAALEAGV